MIFPGRFVITRPSLDADASDPVGVTGGPCDSRRGEQASRARCHRPARPELMIFDGAAAAREERTHKPMRADWRVRAGTRPVSGRADRWIRRTTIGCVGMLALIAGTVSYLHMHLLVELHGQPGWVAALTPLSVDGMIVAASTTLLADSRGGGRGGVLPWALLVAGSAASLAANVAVAEPTLTGRVIAAWPSFSLIAAYELLMRQVRRAAEASSSRQRARRAPSPPAIAVASAVPDIRYRRHPGRQRGAAGQVQLDAWRWAQDSRAGDGSLPSGRDIARQYGRHERWGRLVKQAGLAGELGTQSGQPMTPHPRERSEVMAVR